MATHMCPFSFFPPYPLQSSIEKRGTLKKEKTINECYMKKKRLISRIRYAIHHQTNHGQATNK